MNIQYCLKKASETPYLRRQSRHYTVVLDKKGKVVGEARNEYTKTHTLMGVAGKAVGLPDKTCIHSELGALLKDRYKKGVKLIVVRVDSKNKPAYSEPCECCKHIIKEYFPNIKSIEFSV